MDLDYCDIEWFALETNRDQSVIFETASKFCISDSFVDYDGYSISSKGFLTRIQTSGGEISVQGVSRRERSEACVGSEISFRR